MDWDAKEVRQTVETENERYTVIFGVLQSKRQHLKITKIVKIREETVVGVRLSRMLCIVQKGNRFYVYNQTIAGLIPRKHKLLTDSEFFINFSGTPFHLPEGFKFNYYQNAVECWVHNTILQDPHQLHILVKANFKKFVRALERISTRSTARTTWYFTEGQNVSPFESSSEEEDSVDDEDCDDDEDCKDGEDCENVQDCGNVEDCGNIEDCENVEDYGNVEDCENVEDCGNVEDCEKSKDSSEEDEDDKDDEEESTAEEDYDADDEETSQQDSGESDDSSSVDFDGLDWLCDENRNFVCGSGFDADVERACEVENVKDDFEGEDFSSDFLPEVYDGFRCLFGEGSDVCGDGYDDVKGGGCGTFDEDVKDDDCGNLGDFDADAERVFEVEKVKDGFEGGDFSSDSLPELYDGFRCLFGQGSDVCDDGCDDNKGGGCGTFDDDVKGDGCGDLGEDSLVGCDGFLLLHGDDKNVQDDSFDDDKECCEAVENGVNFKEDGRSDLDDGDFVGFDSFDYLYDKNNDVCGHGLEDVKNGLDTEKYFDVSDSFEDRGDFGGDSVDGIPKFGCFSGEDDDVCDDGVDLNDVKHRSEEVKEYFQSGISSSASTEVTEGEHYDAQKKEEVTEDTMKDEGKEKKQKVKKRKNVFIGWICGKILKVFVKGRVLL